jgi:hypothetical protein
MTASDRPTLSDRADRLGQALKDLPRRQIPLDQLWQLLDATDPATRTFLHRRQLLAEALDELAAAQAIRLPSHRSYDRTEHPPLPRFITVPAAERAHQPRIPTVWHPALSWAADATVAPGHRPVLEKINRWLFTDPGELVVPLRERSLQILGDEKAFDRLQTTGLFLPGRLTLDLLRARRVAPPMHTARVGDGRILLVVENSDTFDSLRTVLTTAPGKVGIIGWGAGAAFEASVLSVAMIADYIDDIAYFGDLDAKGLQVPANADRLATATALPHIRPAVGLYTALERSGHHQPGQPRTETHTATALTNWLDPRHRAWATGLLCAGIRNAQESVGLSWLTEHGDWRSDLT